MTEATVSAGLARSLMRFAASRGADEAELARRAGVDSALLDDQDNRIPFDRYVDLMRAAKAMTGDAALPLHFGEATDMSDFSVVGLISDAAETMVDAFRQLNRYGQLVIEVGGLSNGARFSLLPDGEGRLWLTDLRQNPNEFWELTESTFTRMIVGPRRRFGDLPFVKQVRVTHPKPAHHAEYERIWRVPVTFSAPDNAMEMDPAFTGHRVALLPRYVFGVLSERADALLRELQAARTTRGRVEAELMPVLHTGEASMDAVAAKLGLSRQTLFRKLKAEGVTFEKVLDELRRQLAMHYLAGRKVSVNETAYLVGFSDPAAFSRAFKRWTGQSPREARAAALAAGGS